MKKSIFILFLFPLFLQAQQGELVYQKSGIEQLNDSTYFRLDTIIYESGDQRIDKI